ncbi:hypothetical protein [Bdellovibrio bacteriovorus]|uniref:hypothetical protein n=1 Tax=Bdellovibrio TaxID=958 RepID=UPI0035A907AA
MKIHFILATLVFILSGCTHFQRQPSSVTAAEALSNSDKAIYEKLLKDSLLFYNHVLRDPNSGQYYDAVNLDPSSPPDYNSSVASTGMGLIALALADATSVDTGARAKALQSLSFILGEGYIQGARYESVRSKTGWFRHWFDARTGKNNSASKGDGFSTVDTAILAAGAQIAANYFSATGQDPDGQLRKLADHILLSVHWATAVADVDKGRLYLNYNLETEQGLGTTAVFNEYLVVACMGKYAETKSGKPGKMSAMWDLHYGQPHKLPHKEYQGIQLMTDHPGHYLSSFTVQFVNYLCGAANHSEAYLRNMANSQKADRLWFSQQSNKAYMWGLGAGEVRYRDPSTNQIRSSYHANAINENPHLIVSPHIIAGFIPVYPEGLADLVTMVRNKECIYNYGSYEILWRCSLMDLQLPIDRLQSIDYSSMFLGLATADPRVGMDFFRHHSAFTNEAFFPKEGANRILEQRRK